MDATDLQFLDESFSVITSFFGFMYMPMKIHPKVLSEVYRVLKPNGKFFVWDISVIKPMNMSKPNYAFYLNIKMPYTTAALERPAHL